MNDEGSPAKGIMWAVPLGIGVWVVIAALWWLL